MRCFFKNPLLIRKHYFRHGVKKLLYEITAPSNISIFLVHFSLSHRARAQQIENFRYYFPQEKGDYLRDFNILVVCVNSIHSCRERIFVSSINGKM